MGCHPSKFADFGSPSSLDARCPGSSTKPSEPTVGSSCAPLRCSASSSPSPSSRPSPASASCKQKRWNKKKKRRRKRRGGPSSSSASSSSGSLFLCGARKGVSVCSSDSSKASSSAERTKAPAATEGTSSSSGSSSSCLLSLQKRQDGSLGSSSSLSPAQAAGCCSSRLSPVSSVPSVAQHTSTSGQQLALSSSKLLDRFLKPSILHSRIQRGVTVDSSYSFEEGVALGTGISGTVRVAIHRDTKMRFAVKSLNVVNICPRKTIMLYNEVSIYLCLDHPNIAKLYEVYEDSRAIHLVMELCTGKELYDRLASKKKYHERDAVRVARQMLSAINYCHKHRICHRDLKLENWVYADSSDDAPLKLIDFGFSRIFNPGVPMTAMHGTVYYVSPEVMDGCYREKCDIWSIGVIVYMLLSGSPPFNGTYDHEILVKIKRAAYSFQGPRWQGISKEAKDFITQLLQKDPEKRLSAHQALRHPWLNPVENRKDVQIDVAVLKTMLRFAASSAMKRAALGVIAYSMQIKDLEELASEFKKIDLQDNGTIRLGQLVDLLTSRLNISEEKARQIFQKIDQTGDDEVHYSEFLASTLLTKVVLDESLVRATFQRFDLDRSGFISLDNLRQVLGDHYDGKQIEDILHGVTYNGMLNYDEFLTALCSDEVGEDTFSPDSIASTISKNLLAVSEGPPRIPTMSAAPRTRVPAS